MSATSPLKQSRSFIGRVSRSSVGRVSGAFSRLLGGTSAVQAAGRFLRRQLWAWPLIAAVLFGGVGWWIYRSVDHAMRQQRVNDLNAMVDASTNAVRIWTGEQRINVELVSTDEQLRPMVAELLRLSDSGPAHAGGLVHRDVKPANIVLTRRGGLHDFVKVLDFGLAKALDGPEKASVTSPNALMGTPLYLSPEAVNQPDQVDARSDVYALAAVGYFLLTGTPVFKGASVMEIIMQHARSAPEPPSTRGGKPVSPDLESLLLRCLAKSQADRPGDAATMLRELEACTVEGSWTALDAAAWWAALDKAVDSSEQTERARDQRAGHQQTPAPDKTVAYEEGMGRT